MRAEEEEQRQRAIAQEYQEDLREYETELDMVRCRALRVAREVARDVACRAKRGPELDVARRRAGREGGATPCNGYISELAAHSSISALTHSAQVGQEADLGIERANAVASPSTDA